MHKTRLAMNLQTFAEGETGGNGTSGTTGEGTSTAPSGNQPVQIDYEKIANIVAGKQSATENSVLKGYFKQQGLTKEQMDQAIAAYKEQQAANQPDVAGMQSQIAETQNQLTAAQKAAQDARVESAATMMAVSLGVDAKTIPYILKMADFSQVTGEDGKINEETLKAAVNKVLEDVPALKPQAGGNTGFSQIGTGGNPAQHTPPGSNQPAVPTKRWNRFNN